MGFITIKRAVHKFDLRCLMLQKEIQLPFAEQETYIHPSQVFQTRGEDP